MCKGFQGFVDQYNSGFNLHDEENSSTLENTGAVFVLLGVRNLNIIISIHDIKMGRSSDCLLTKYHSVAPHQTRFFIKAGCPVLLLQFL